MRPWHVYLRLGAFTRRDGRGQIPVKCHLVRLEVSVAKPRASVVITNDPVGQDMCSILCAMAEEKRYNAAS